MPVAGGSVHADEDRVSSSRPNRILATWPKLAVGSRLKSNLGHVAQID